MSRAAKSILAYGVYLILLGLALLIAPNVPLPLFGLPTTDEVWVRIVGMSVLFLAIYFIQAARHEWTDLFRVSVYLRASVPLFFGAFVALGLASPALLLFTPPDLLFALWTLLALRTARVVMQHA
jgi:hypothetical protein